MRRYINFLESYKYILVISLTIITAFFAIAIKDIAFDGSYRVWFNKESKIIKDYDNFRDMFGNDEKFIIAFRDKDSIFNKKAINLIKSLTNECVKLDGVKRVDSILNFKTLLLNNGIKRVNIIDEDNFFISKKRALKNKIVTSTLLSKDAKTTLIVVSLVDKSKNKELNVDIFNKLKNLKQKYEKSSGYKIYISGVPSVTASLVSVAKSDAIKLMPLAVICVVLLLAILFRDIIGIIVPSIVIVYTFLIVLGMQLMLGYKLNNFTVNIPAFISAIAIASSLHLYMAWIYYKQKNYGTKEALYFALNKNFTPIAMTSITTAIGFATLAFSKIVPISTLGIAISSGAILAFIFSVTLAPAIILMLKDSYKVKNITFLDFSKISGYGEFIAKNNKKILSIFVILIAILAYGIRYIKVDSNSLNYFAKDTIVRSGSNFLQKNITGSFVYDIVIDSNEVNGIYNPKFVKKILEFEKTIKKSHKEVRNTLSIADLIEDVNKKITSSNKLPNSNMSIKTYINFYKNNSKNFNELVSKDSRYIKITINTNSQETSKDLKLIKFIEDWWSKNSKYKASVEGQTTIFTYMQRDVTKTLVNSILATIAIVTFAMLLLFRDLKLLLLFVLPNIAPIILVAGVMGYMGINIDIGVAISAAVILGIAVDDTIHFFNKFLDAIKTKNFEESIDYVISSSGNAMILTTLILSFTFAIFLISSFMPNVHFAIVTIVALNLALLLDLVLLPALLSLIYKKD